MLVNCTAEKLNNMKILTAQLLQRQYAEQGIEVTIEVDGKAIENESTGLQRGKHNNLSACI